MKFAPDYRSNRIDDFWDIFIVHLAYLAVVCLSFWLLSLSGCAPVGGHHSDGPPAPVSSSEVSQAATQASRDHAAELAKVARQLVDKAHEFKGFQEAFDYEKPLNTSIVSRVYKQLTDAQDARFKKSDTGELIWDADEFAKVFQETAEGFERAAGVQSGGGK